MNQFYNLNWNENIEYDEFLAKLEMPYLKITGNDLLLDNDFWRFLENLSAKGIITTISDNPNHLTSSSCKRLTEFGCREYEMQLMGLRKTHDLLFNRGSYDLTLSKVTLLKRFDIKSRILTVISKENISQIPWMIDDVVRLNADNFSLKRGYDDFNQFGNILKKFIEYKDSGTSFSLSDS